MNGSSETARKKLGYTLSLPERALRSLAAVAGGTSLLLTDTLLPEVLRRTTIYRILIGDLQRFVILKVAQVQQEEQGEGSDVSEDFVRRKMAGTALELAGLLTVHFSPLWVFAIAGDAAAGSKVFLDRLVTHLRQDGVIAQDADPKDLTDLLDSMQAASRTTARAIDTPPLNRAGLQALADEMTESYRAMFSKGREHLPEFEAITAWMERLAEGQEVSVEALSGVMAIDATRWRTKGAGTARAAGKAGAELFGENILASYARTLDGVAKQGVADYLARSMKPFLEVAGQHFDASKPSWTENRLAEREEPGVS